MIRNNGQHPTISWDFSYDTDITNYNIYRSVDGAIFHKIATVTSSVNTYTDNSVTISGGQFSPEICYKITALDITNLESEKSASDCIHSDTFMEKRKSSSKGQDEILDNLFHVYPNPFNPETIVSYSVAKDGLVELTLYNILGKKIITLINGYKEMGKHTFNIDFDKIDRNLSSGIYIIIFKTNGNIFQQKINYIK